jgi:phosphohistidine phosphatase
MNLYILRHGLAVEPGTAGYARDSERPLLPKGERKLRKIAKAMKALELTFDLILSSPYLRARQTAQIIAESYGSRKEVEVADALVPGGSAKKLIESINQLKPEPDTVLLVGHEPYLSNLISLLICGETGLPIVMKKAGLCKLTADPLEYGRCAALDWLLTPKQLSLMS